VLRIHDDFDLRNHQFDFYTTMIQNSYSSTTLEKAKKAKNWDLPFVFFGKDFNPFQNN
jgi:hypothetical protein